MRRRVRVAFAYFWRGFSLDAFQSFFPAVHREYDLVVSDDPEVVFYSVFAGPFTHLPGGQYAYPAVRPPAGNYVRVFMTGENAEPDMSACDFAISYSTKVNSPNHLYLPLWVYENRAWGFGPERLVEQPGTDWEKVAAGKSRFCNFLYSHDIDYRNDIFTAFSRYKHIDAPGRCMCNMQADISFSPNRTAGKVKFFQPYKFTLAVEGFISPGYTTEKLVDPMFADSIPIYVGDPQAHTSFNTGSYVDAMCFSSLNEMIDFVREVDNSSDLYLKMLSTPHYLRNRPPAYADERRTLAFFDRIFASV